MEACEIVYEVLKNLNISYDLVEHPPAWTTKEADCYIKGKEGARTKSLFLCNRNKSGYFLIILDDEKRLNMKRLGELICEKGMSFCSAERLMEKMGLSPGAVSPFGLLNNKERDIKIYLDKDILSEKVMTFHPNDNSKTIFIATEDLYRFILSLSYEYSVIDL